MSTKNSVELDLGFPVYGLRFVNNTTVLVCGGGGEGKNGIPNKITAIRCSFNVSDKTRRLQKFREITLPSNEDSPMCIDFCKNPSADNIKYSIFVGCNQSTELIKSMNINNNLRKYVYNDEEHLKFLDAVQFNDNLSTDSIGEYPKIVQTARDSAVGALMTSRAPSEIFIFNPESLELNMRFKPSSPSEIKDFHINPEDGGQTLTYVTASFIETISTNSGNVLFSSLSADKKMAGVLQNYFFSKIRYVTGSKILVTAAKKNGKGSAIIEYDISSRKVTKERLISSKIKGIVAIDVSSAAGLVAVAGNDFSVSLLRLTDLKVIKSYNKLHAFAITCLSFSPNGKKLATGSAANSLNVLQVPSSSGGILSFISALFKYAFFAILVGFLSFYIQKAHEQGDLDQVIELSRIYGGDALTISRHYAKIGFGLSRKYGAEYYHYAQQYGKVALGVAKVKGLEGFDILKEKLSKQKDQPPNILTDTLDWTTNVEKTTIESTLDDHVSQVTQDVYELTKSLGDLDTDSIIDEATRALSSKAHKASASVASEDNPAVDSKTELSVPSDASSALSSVIADTIPVLEGAAANRAAYENSSSVKPIVHEDSSTAESVIRENSPSDESIIHDNSPSAESTIHEDTLSVESIISETTAFVESVPSSVADAILEAVPSAQTVISEISSSANSAITDTSEAADTFGTETSSSLVSAVSIKSPYSEDKKSRNSDVDFESFNTSAQLSPVVTLNSSSEPRDSSEQQPQTALGEKISDNDHSEPIFQGNPVPAYGENLSEELTEESEHDLDESLVEPKLNLTDQDLKQQIHFREQVEARDSPEHQESATDTISQANENVQVGAESVDSTTDELASDIETTEISAQSSLQATDSEHEENPFSPQDELSEGILPEADSLQNKGEAIAVSETDSEYTDMTHDTENASTVEDSAIEAILNAKNTEEPDFDAEVNQLQEAEDITIEEAQEGITFPHETEFEQAVDEMVQNFETENASIDGAQTTEVKEPIDSHSSPQIIDEAVQEIDETLQGMGDASQEIDEALQVMGDASQEIDEALQEVGEAPQEIDEALQEVGEAPQEIDEALQEVGEAPQEIDEASQESDGEKVIDSSLSAKNEVHDAVSLGFTEQEHETIDGKEGKVSHDVNESRVKPSADAASHDEL